MLSQAPRRRHVLPRAMRGFTLIELIVVLAIVAIATLIALPSLRELLVRSATTTTANDLVTALSQARAEAIKRGTPVAVLSRSGGADWSSGWDVAASRQRNTTFDEVIASREALGDGYHVKVHADDNHPERVLFTSQGELVGAQPASPNEISLNVCRPDHNAAQSRLVRVAASGQVTTRRDTSTSEAPAC
jgi:type IV fimbrial biogenesis protein FimT